MEYSLKYTAVAALIAPYYLQVQCCSYLDLHFIWIKKFEQQTFHLLLTRLSLYINWKKIQYFLQKFAFTSKINIPAFCIILVPWWMLSLSWQSVLVFIILFKPPFHSLLPTISGSTAVIAPGGAKPLESLDLYLPRTVKKTLWRKASKSQVRAASSAASGPSQWIAKLCVWPWSRLTEW